MSSRVLDAALANIPPQLCDSVSSWSREHQQQLDTLLRFCLGAPCTHHVDHNEWTRGQTRFQSALKDLIPNGVQNPGKHARDDDNNESSEKQSKKQKLSSDGGGDQTPLSVLHALSVTSPLRKKLNITITPSSLLLTNPTSTAIESTIPLSSLSRAFLVSNLGKNRNKPHWTVTILSSDKWDKQNAASQMQVTFAVDHAPSNAKDLFTTTTYPPGEPISFDKGTRTFSHLKAFLDSLPGTIPIIISAEPKTSDDPEKAYIHAFRSSSGQPYVEAYRNAKEGSLYLLNTGILWAESKPAEFFALEGVAPDDDELGSGVKTLSATGRTFSIFVRRKGVLEKQKSEKDDGEGSDDEESEEEVELVGEETEFAMVDGKEHENVMQWIRTYRRQFGKKKSAGGAAGRSAVTTTGLTRHANGSPSKAKGKEKMTPEQVQAQERLRQQQQKAEDELDSDASDEDFVAPSDSDGGEPSSGSSDDEGSDAVGNRTEEESDEDDDESEGSGGEDGDEDAESEGEEEGEFDPKHHPLLRPGAMPKMSRAAMDMVVGMVSNDLTGGGDGDEEDGEDELMDD